MISPRRQWLPMLAAAALAISGFAQSFTASVRGNVTDQSSAAVPSAKVTVTDADRGTVFNTVADEAGRYVVTALPPGTYVLTVEAPGFKRFSTDRFTVNVQQQVTVNAALEVGEVSTTVEVQGSAALVNTTIANLGQVIENKYILSLPNIARNSMSMAYLTPGVVGSGGRRGDNNTNFVANGSRNSTSDVLIDGVTTVAVEQNSGITDLKFQPSIDVLQEFKMQTNFFSAEYGQTGGAVVNMVTRSGTNDFHGTGYYFLRDSALNANDWFSNRAGRAIPDFHRDQFGGVIGGPVIRNKTFFFGGYEHTRESSPFSRTATVPTELQRRGDFSQTFNGAGQLMTIYNPFDTFVNAAGNIERRPFAGNVIPQSMMDPVALKALAFYPLPNQQGAPFTNTNNWFQQGVSSSRAHQINVKGDHNFNNNNRLSGRWSHGRSNGQNPNLFGEGNPAMFTGGPNQNRVHGCRLHARSQRHNALHVPLRSDLRGLRPQPVLRIVRLDNPRPARGYADHVDPRRVPALLARRFPGDRNRRLVDYGPPGAGAPLVGIDDEDCRRPQHQGRRRAPLQRARLLAAGLSVG
jgi:hypothetical protein